MSRFIKMPVDVMITSIAWIYFIIGYLLFFSPFYIAAYVFSRSRETAFQKLNHFFFKSFFSLIHAVTPGLRFHIPEEVSAIRSSVIVSNHLSYLDPILMVSLFEKQKTIVKNDIFQKPVFGRILNLSGYIPVAEDDEFHTIMLDRIKNMRDYLASGGNLFIFPEGTRSRDGHIGKFHKGAFRIARRCNSTLKVLRIENTDLLFKPGRFRFNTCISNTIRIRHIADFDFDQKNAPLSDRIRHVRSLLRHPPASPDDGENNR